jgi:hypothetical protein
LRGKRFAGGVPTYATKDTKEGNGQDEHDDVPSCTNDAAALRHARDEVGNAGDGRENAHDDSEDLISRYSR